MSDRASTSSKATCSISSKLSSLKQQLNDIINLSRSGFKTGALGGISFDSFVTACEDVKNSIEKCVCESQKSTVIHDTCCQIDDKKIQIKGKDIPDYIKNVIGLMDVQMVDTPEYMKQIIHKNDEEKPVSSNKMCHSSKCSNLENNSQTLDEYVDYLSQIVTMVQDCRKEGIMSDSVTEFIHSCEKIKSKIERQAKYGTKIDNLKQHIDKLESITAHIDKDIDSASIKEFLKTCKKFKCKLDDYKKFKETPKFKNSKSFETFVRQISDTAILGQKAQVMGWVPECMENFVKLCEYVVQKLDDGVIVGQQDIPESTILSVLGYNIDDIIAYISKYKDQDLISSSVNNFLLNCELVRNKIDYYNNHPCQTTSHSDADKLCTGECNICNNKPKLKPASKSSSRIIKNPCITCYPPPEPDTICNACNNNMPSQSERPETFTISKQSSGQRSKPSVTTTIITGNPEDVGYFENISKKIIRVHRYKDKDGKVKEEKETVTVFMQKHDPKATKMIDDEFEILVNNDSVAGPPQNQRVVGIAIIPQSFAILSGIIKPTRYVKSEDNILNNFAPVTPMFKRSHSADFTFMTKEFEICNHNLSDM